MTPQELFDIGVRKHQSDGEFLSALQVLLGEREESAAAMEKLRAENKRLQEAVQTLQLCGPPSVAAPKEADGEPVPHGNGSTAAHEN